MSTIFIVIPILTLLMFDLGLELRPADFKLIARQPRPVLAGLIGQIILLPLLAWTVASVAGLQPVFFIGVMLIACSPGGSSSNVFSMLAKGDVALSVTLTACSSVITLFTIPLIMAFTTQWVGTGTDIHLPVGNLLVQNIILMAVPIAIGLILAARKPKIAARIHAVLKKNRISCSHPPCYGVFHPAPPDHCQGISFTGNHNDCAHLVGYGGGAAYRMAHAAQAA